jgi:hypothetical protein
MNRAEIRDEVDARLCALGYGTAWRSWQRATLRLHDSDGSIVHQITVKAGVTSRKRLAEALKFLPIAGPARHYERKDLRKRGQFCLLAAIEARA